MRLLKVKVTYQDKDKKEKTAYNFYIELDSGSKIAIKNAFKDDYKLLSALAIDTTLPF